ncbi:hypothetical protein Pfo_004926 [Paulownia fortunei]|nr:hypothetical protein Pfo_004926 [Paulownia fortunei]
MNLGIQGCLKLPLCFCKITILSFSNQQQKMANCKIPSRDEGKKKRTPKGHIVVYVGEQQRRFVVPISCLKNPQFQELLEEAAEVYGFHSYGGIMLPCSESTFFRVINFEDKRY